MRPNLFATAVRTVAVALVALSSFGCSKSTISKLVPNQRPVVRLTNAPVNQNEDPSFYAYRLNWIGFDSDGRVAYYTYAIDPPSPAEVAAGQDTVWTRTVKNEEIVFFRATDPIVRGSSVRDTAQAFHIFVLKAWDDAGAASEPISRAFFSYTVAPFLQITSPLPSRLLVAHATPAVRINWTGTDPDGQFTQKPVKYKYKLITATDPVPIDVAIGDPDSLRRYYAPTFAGWDSTSAETTFVQFTNLTPDATYLFVVVAFDEAGAYSPIFTLDSNMLLFDVGFAATLGPRFFLFNEFFNYRYPSGGYILQPQVFIEVPAGRPITYVWFAEAPSGSIIRYYRWVVDLADLTDETPRTDERTDIYHWSAKSPLTNFATLPPFPGGASHELKIETEDNNGLKSLAVLQFTPVQPTLARSLLVVDDTRLEVDKIGPNGCPNAYGAAWPSRTELDTFFFARGNVPWRCKPVGTVSPPGVLAGYDFDTLGTRQGFEVVTNGAKLSKLGQYQHVVWLVDGLSAFAGTNGEGGTHPTNPITALRYMSGPGQASTVATYTSFGGKLWAAGGGCGYASMIPWNATGSRANDNLYGTVFSNSAGELVPGRFMYDVAHWQFEMVCARGFQNISRSDRAVGGWAGAPDYSHLPIAFNPKSPATDPLPPGRTSNNFYTSVFPIEYISDLTSITEDVNPDPEIVEEQSVMDTLFKVTGSNIKIVGIPGQPGTAACMTYYHGTQGGPMIFTGFEFWNYRRSQCVQLVDFVLQDIWGLTRNTAISRTPSFAAASASPRNVLTPAQRSVNRLLPIGRARE